MERQLRLLGGRRQDHRKRSPFLGLVTHNVLRYTTAMIVSFHDSETETIWQGRRSRRLPADIQVVALRKLRLLNNARRLDDLRAPPENRLEALTRERRGRHAIRINDQWRICFLWKDNNAHEVEIVDYH
jgi:proteic killer suppression protein